MEISEDHIKLVFCLHFDIIIPLELNTSCVTLKKLRSILRYKNPM